MIKSFSSVIRVTHEQEREWALSIIRDIYQNEKQWIRDESEVFPREDLTNHSISWFIVFAENEPAGVLRVLYDPPLDLYMEYEFETLEEGLDLDAFIQNHKIAEIGRFAVRRKFRQKIYIASSLMRAATEDTLRRGYTHYITDVFEGEINSPYDFHMRVIGFKPVATHQIGEMNCPNRRITLILNLKDAYNRLKMKNNRFYRYITEGWDSQLHELMSV